jgi:hypothetical protein
MDKRTKDALQNTIQKTKDRTTRTSPKSGVNSGPHDELCTSSISNSVPHNIIVHFAPRGPALDCE